MKGPRFSWRGARSSREASLQASSGSSSIRRKEHHVEVEDVIAAVLAGTMFRLELENKHLELATICGKMRKRLVRLTVGDRVKMEMFPYDLTKGRITWRLPRDPHIQIL